MFERRHAGRNDSDPVIPPQKRMKNKIIALLLAGTICFSFAACGESGAKTTQESQDSIEQEETLDAIDDAKAESNEKAANEEDDQNETADAADDAFAGTSEELAEEDYDLDEFTDEIDDEAAGPIEEIDAEEYEQIEIPDAVTNISPDDDKALTGVLTEDYYKNEYFGLTISKVEGGSIDSLMDSGTDLMPLSETYTKGIGGIYINSTGTDGSLSVTVSALTSKDQGKTENDLAQDRFAFEKGFNEAAGYEAECSVETIAIAGEEHPAYIEITDDGEEKVKSASVFIIKGDFSCVIGVYGAEDKFDEILKLFEKN